MRTDLPIGFRFGVGTPGEAWCTTISKTYRGDHPYIPGRTISMVDCLCDCGAIFSRVAIKVKRGDYKGCGRKCSASLMTKHVWASRLGNANYFGTHPTGYYRDSLWKTQKGICAWPKCPTPDRILDKNGLTTQVDHNNRCCNFKRKTGKPASRACDNCVRGLVHRPCNVLYIAACDFALKLGAVFPEEIMDYLTKGDSTSQEALN